MAKKDPTSELIGLAALASFHLVKSGVRLLRDAGAALLYTHKSQTENEETPPPRSPGDHLVVEFVCAVAGTSFDTNGKSRAKFIRSNVAAGDTAVLRREPDNPYDRNAVAVYVHDFQIGYLRREVAERHAYEDDDPSLYAAATVRRVGSHNPPGVFLNFALYASKEAADSGIIAVRNGRFMRQPLAARYLGRTSKEWLTLQPNSLETLLGCCRAEVALVKERSLEDIEPPSGAVFRRACILCRKEGRYDLEIKLCKAWMGIVAKHDADRVVTVHGRKPLAASGPHKNIIERLPKAVALLNARNAKQ